MRLHETLRWLNVSHVSNFQAAPLPGYSLLVNIDVSNMFTFIDLPYFAECSNLPICLLNYVKFVSDVGWMISPTCDNSLLTNTNHVKQAQYLCVKLELLGFDRAAVLSISRSETNSCWLRFFCQFAVGTLKPKKRIDQGSYMWHKLKCQW